MKAYYGSRFSPNQTVTPEGFLVCLNVPIARTGRYEYLASEIDVDEPDGDKVVKVIRSPEEVFSRAAMASFEGKPVVDGHPDEGVTSENAHIYAKGAAQNVRRGTGSDSDLLLADLIIYDQQLINDIRSGKREVSCGYECDYEPNGDGTYSQTGIVGNHVAVVPEGRAGHRVRIKDSVRKRLGHDELMAMIDDKPHNHLDVEHIQQALREGGDVYVLRQVDPNTLGVEYHESLNDTTPDFDPSKAKPIIVGRNGFVIDGRHRVMSAIKSGVRIIDAYVPNNEQWFHNRAADSVDGEAEKAAKQYGIAVKKDGHKSPPEGYPADREQYGDPVNYKYPLTGEHKEAAVEYFNHLNERIKGGYTTQEWAKVGHRIAAKLGSNYVYQNGKILTPEDRKKEANDSMPRNRKAPLPQRQRMTDWLIAKGLKVWAQDAEPEELVDTVDALMDEREGGDDDTENREPEEKKGTKDDSEDVSRIDALEKKFDAFAEMIQKALAGKTSDEKTAEETLDAEIEKSGSDEGGSETIDPDEDDMTTDEPGPVAPAEDRPKNPITGDSRRAFLQSIKPIIAAIPDEKTKKQVVDAAIANFKGRSGRNAYGSMVRGTRDNVRQKQTNESQPVDHSELGMNIARKYNPHYQDHA